MPTIEVRAVSPALPVDDLLAHPEGGPDAAAAALSRLLPGTSYEHVATGTWAEPHHDSFDAVLVSTFGETTLLLASPVPRVTVPEGMTTFSLSYQTVSMAYDIDVSGPLFERFVALSPGVLDHAAGSPLPFEERFGRGIDEANATYSFDDDGFARAAGAWMFGCQPLRPGADDRVDLRARPVHTFEPAAVPAPVADVPGPQPRPGALRRLFGRR